MREHRQDRRQAVSIDVRAIRPPPAFAIAAGAPAGGVTVVALRGELDIAAAPVLRAHLDAATGRALVLDLAGVTFVDSAVLRELLRARGVLAARDARLVLAGAPRQLLRLLDLTLTSELFDHAPDAETALKRLSA